MNQLDKRLSYLKDMLLRMSDIVIENVTRSLYIYQSSEEVAYINDDVVDQYERLIEEICIDILIREKLYATDLREVVGILRLVADLERIGDHAEDIMTYNIKLRPNSTTVIQNINIMAKKSIDLIKLAIDAFINKDLEKAEAVINGDDEVDELFLNITRKLAEVPIQNSDEQKSILYSSFVVKYLERIADHAVNIADWVIYIVKGIHKQR